MRRTATITALGLLALAMSALTPAAAAAAAAAAPPPTTRRAPAVKPVSTAGEIVLTGAKIHVGDGTVIDDGAVVIRAGRITAVGPASVGTSASGSAARVDLGGKWLTPGFIAAASPIGLVELDAEPSTVDSQREDVDAIRAGYDAAVAIHADSSLLAVNAIEGITTAAATPVGGMISGQVAWIDLVTGDHAGIVARPRVAVQAQLGQSFGGSRAAAFARLEEAFDDAAFFGKRRPAYDRRQSRDLVAHPRDLQALLPILAGDIPLVVSAHRASDLLALAEFAQRRGIHLTIVGGTQAWKVADRLAAADVTVIVQPSENLPGGFDRLGARLDNAALLHAAGVRVGIAVLGEAHNVRNVAQEAGIAVANGLPADAALTAVTLEIARAYGMQDDYGTLSVGKVANVVAWDGDPFELSNVPTQVWIRGAAIPMRSRQTELRDRYLDLSRYGRGGRSRR
jgi:imidazolonepropionase-like amidohydrolase